MSEALRTKPARAGSSGTAHGQGQGQGPGRGHGQPGAAASRAARARARRRRVLEWIALHSIAIAAAIIFIGPVVFLFLTSVMSDQQALTSALWPHAWRWTNYATVFDKAPLLEWFRNTVMYAVLATVFMLVSSVPVAYALARFRFRGRNLAFMLVVATMMLPPQVVVVPMYIVWSRLHLTGTLWPLILPMLFGDAFSIFLLRQFLLTVPKEYVDAAKVDGCGELRTLLQVVVPMIRPALAAVALFQFFYSWNDFFGPQVYTAANIHAWTLAVGLWSFKGLHHVQWNLTMAAALLIMAPVILMFFFAQKAFIEGVTLTGVKG